MRGIRAGSARALAAVWGAVWAASLMAAAPGPQSPAGATSARAAGGGAGADLTRVLDQYCVGCHNARSTGPAVASGMVLDAVDPSRVGRDGALWEKVVRKLRTRSMPPAGLSRPSDVVYDSVVARLESTLDRAARERPTPGRHLPHRLNRAEYANVVRDLLAIEVDPAALLPPDDSIDGFDNNADQLGVSPALIERYLSAAATISALAVGSPSIVASSETYRVRGDASQTDRIENLPVGTRGGVVATHTFPLDGEYTIKVKLLETNLGSIRGLEYRHDLEITIDDERVLLAPVGGPEDYVESSVNATNVVNSLERRLQVRVLVRAGQRKVGAAFLRKPASLGPTRLQPFLRSTLIATDHLGLPHVENMVVSGPFNPTGPGHTPSRDRVFLCRPPRGADEAAERRCAVEILSTLARRAYRRPVTDADTKGLLAFYDRGRREAGFERGIELGLRGVLVSPKFLVRVERDPEGVAPGAAYRVSDLELASRLSFFLWSSIPDDELLTAASQGRLREPAVLDRQVRRMLADPKAAALVGNFAGQWLHVRNVKGTTPDKNDFPNFDDNLRRSFERELELFVGAIVREDRSALELLTADFTYLDERLARHYGIPNVYGARFRRVTVTEEARKGLLGKGGVLLVTSHADRTSPVVRGKWILENLLGTPPPPPPAVVPAFPDTAPGGSQAVRARMELHRSNPACAGCHRIMDPLGLALENFDAVGAWRREDAGVPIDATGELVDGTRVNGVVALREALLTRPDVLMETMAEKLLTYALGRGLEHYDMPAVRAIVAEARNDRYRFSALVRAIVESVPFQMRSAPEA